MSGLGVELYLKVQNSYGCRAHAKESGEKKARTRSDVVVRPQPTMSRGGQCALELSPEDNETQLHPVALLNRTEPFGRAGACNLLTTGGERAIRAALNSFRLTDSEVTRAAQRISDVCASKNSSWQHVQALASLDPNQLLGDDVLTALYAVFPNMTFVCMREGLPTVCRAGRTPNVYLTNPSTLGSEFTVKLTGWSVCRVGSRKAAHPSLEAVKDRSLFKTAWFRREGGKARLVHVLDGAEDGRLFRHGRRTHVIFSRFISNRRGTANSISWEQADGSLKTATLMGFAKGYLDHNYVPGIHGNSHDTFYVQQALCRRRRMLKCNTTKLRSRLSAGRWCEIAYVRNASWPCHPFLGGTSNTVLLPTSLAAASGITARTRLAVAHAKMRSCTKPTSFFYAHLFYLFDAEPPFLVRYLSQPFRFPPTFFSDVDHVQFCTGAEMIRNSRSFAKNSSGSHSHNWSHSHVLRLSYGIGDCAASSVDVSLAEVIAKTVGCSSCAIRHGQGAGGLELYMRA